MIKIGVLSLQGDVEEHVSMMRKTMEGLGISGSVEAVRTKEVLHALSALVIPGGESTTLCKLARMYGVDEEIKKIAKNGIPIMGTCAGLVLLASKGCEEVGRTGQALLGVIDVAVFIRAPSITHAGKSVRILAEYAGRIVAAEKENVIVLAFHPELSADTRIHEYFLKKVAEYERTRKK
jgi:5'-phosphate synthase pdxT subunit